MKTVIFYISAVFPVLWALAGPAWADPAQTITFPDLQNKENNAVPFSLEATADSGLTVSYAVVSTGGVATVSGNTVTLTGATGAATITATQAGGGSFAAAVPVSRTFVVFSGNGGYARVARGSDASHTVLIKNDGTLWALGSNDSGQLGDGTTTSRHSPIQVGTEGGWLTAAVGGRHTTAIKSDGTLWAWGRNSNGQLGTGETLSSSSPVQVGTPGSRWQSVTANRGHTAALKSDGTLWAWGSNEFGELGDGSTMQRNSPVQVGTETNWRSVAAGVNYTAAVRSDGTLWTWGQNRYSQLGDGSTTNASSPIQVGTATNWESVDAGDSHTVAVRSDGTLWAWGGSYGISTGSPARVDTATNWQSAAAGGGHTLAEKTDGTLWSWGNNSSGQLGRTLNRTVTAFPGPVRPSGSWQSFSAGRYHTVGVRSDGTLWACGRAEGGQLASVSQPVSLATLLGNQRVEKCAVGETHTMAVMGDGALWAWGQNGFGQFGNGSYSSPGSPVRVGNENNWRFIAAGAVHTAAVKSDGTLWAWGGNSEAQVGDGSNTQRSSPVRLGTAADWQSVVAGARHTVAMKRDGTLWAWGANEYGQLGDGSTTRRSRPVQVGTADNWQSVAAGMYQTMAIKSDGTLWVWGWNFYGQLGDGSTMDRLVPVQVGTAANWVSVAAGIFHTVAVKSDRTLWAWGVNGSGQLGDGSTVLRDRPIQVGTATDWQSVAAGRIHTMAVKSDGTLWAWGANDYGQLGDGSLINRLSPAQVGTARGWNFVISGPRASHSLALRSGWLWAFGENFNGQVPGSDVGRMLPRLSAPARVPQTIVFPPLSLTTGIPVTLAAASESGLPISYAVSGPATLSGTTITRTGSGEVMVDAWQPGDVSAWLAAPVTMFISAPPRVGDPTHTAITATTAMLGGNVIGGEGAMIIERGVVYSATVSNPTLETGTKVIAEGTNSVFTTIVSGLGEQTTYTYRAFATNSAGTTYTDAATFTTLSAPPVFLGYAVSTTANITATITHSSLLARTADPDGGTPAISNVSPHSAFGGVVSNASDNITYTPPHNYTGLDTFTVTITDGQGGSTPVTIIANVTGSAGTGGGQAFIAKLPANAGVATLHYGTPGSSYVIQRSTDLINWSTRTTLTAAPDGTLPYVDTTPPEGRVFYRSKGQ